MSISHIPDGTEQLSLEEAVSQLVEAENVLDETGDTEDGESPPEGETADTGQENEDQEDAVETEETPDEADDEADDTDDADEADDEEADDEDADEGDDEELYTVTIDGEEHEVTLEALTSSYQIEGASRKRLSEAAEAKKLAENERTELARQRGEYVERLEAIAETANPYEASEEEWRDLQAQDPVEFMLRREKHRDYEASIEAVKKEAATELQNSLVEAANTARREIPGWDNPKTVQAEFSAMVEFATSLGFAVDEVNSIADPRLIKLLNVAAKAQKTAEKTDLVKKRVKSKKPIKKGSVRKLPSKTSKLENQIKQARKRFEDSGSIEDGAALDVLEGRLAAEQET